MKIKRYHRLFAAIAGAIVTIGTLSALFYVLNSELEVTTKQKTWWWTAAAIGFVILYIPAILLLLWDSIRKLIIDGWDSIKSNDHLALLIVLAKGVVELLIILVPSLVLIPSVQSAREGVLPVRIEADLPDRMRFGESAKVTFRVRTIRELE